MRLWLWPMRAAKYGVFGRGGACGLKDAEMWEEEEEEEEEEGRGG